jgi:hypothetical protein
MGGLLLCFIFVAASRLCCFGDQMFDTAAKDGPGQDGGRDDNNCEDFSDFLHKNTLLQI